MNVAIVNYDDLSIWLFRKGLIRALLLRGHTVHVLCGHGPYVSKIESLGAVHVPIDIPRFISPLRDIAGIFSLYRIFRRHRFGIVHLFQTKINIYAAWAARLAGIREIYGSISGLGFMYTKIDTLQVRILRALIDFMYRSAFACMIRVGFWNPDDLETYCGRGLLGREKAVLIRGSGVDMEEYSPEAADGQIARDIRARIPAPEGGVIVMMVGRAVISKGIREFIEARSLLEPGLRERTVFVLAGDIEPKNPESVTREFLERHRGGGFVCLGWSDHVRECLSLSDIVVLPSYREGLPRSILEALAMHKPVVTTDAPGCRETVENGRNGFLVPVGDARKLADAIAALARDERLRKEFGEESYRKARCEFSQEIVIGRIFRQLYGWAETPPAAAGGGVV